MQCSGLINMVTRSMLSWRFLLRTQTCTKNVLFSSSSPTTVIPKTEKIHETDKASKFKRSNSMVAAAFQSLKDPELTQHNFGTLDETITSAKSIDDLLSIADSNHVNKKHALRIVSVLAEWASENKIKITDFETDARFHKLCRMLGRNYRTKTSVKIDPKTSGDLATVLEVTGDDEAAKLVATISFEQMIKVMATLAQKKRRSTPLLRSLAFNLCRHSQQLNVKQSADLLYSMAVLNFPDESLLDKVRNDLAESLPTNQKAAPVGSVLTSLGLLRHKDPALLDGISEWVCRNARECRPQDLVSFLLTLAHVGYTPSNMDQVVERVCVRLAHPEDVPTVPAWLDVVWSLAVIGRASPELVASVLDAQFVAKLGAAESLGVPAKLKLLNVNAVAKLEMKGYSGPLLVEAELAVPLSRSRGKEVLVKSVLESLANLLPSQTYLRPGRDTGMGFLTEGECLVDTKGNPLAVTDTKEAAERQRGARIALLVWDYADLCRGVTDPSGPNALAVRLLQRQGYRVFPVSHSEFNPREKLLQRVQFLEQRLKALAKEPQSQR